MSGRWSEWRRKQQAALAEYCSPMYISAWDPERERFGAFCDLNGTTLDVGCGITTLPMRYARRENIELVGLDPLSPERAEYSFVRGVGEYLPFRNESFDSCVCASVLDHVVDPNLVLREIWRVLDSAGRLCVWSGTHKTFVQEVSARFTSSHDLIKAREPRHLLRFLKNWAVHSVRSGLYRLLGLSKDIHHFRRFSARSLHAILKRAGFRVVGMEAHESSVFLRACKIFE